VIVGLIVFGAAALCMPLLLAIGYVATFSERRAAERGLQLAQAQQLGQLQRELVVFHGELRKRLAVVEDHVDLCRRGTRTTKRVRPPRHGER